MNLLLALLLQSCLHCIAAAPEGENAPLAMAQAVAQAVPRRVQLPEPAAGPVQAVSPTTDLPPDVRDLLNKAARFQRGDTPRSRPTSFHGRFSVYIKNHANDSSINAKVERFYVREPLRLLTHRVDTLVESRSTVGYDEGRVWFRDDRTGRVEIYSDDPATFQVDLDQIDLQLRLMPLVLDAAVVDALIPRLTHTSLVRDAGEIVDLSGRTHAIHRVVARIDNELFEPEMLGPPPMPGAPAPPADQLEIQLDIDKQTGALWGLTVRTLGRSQERRIELKIRAHAAAPDGLLVPANIKIYEDGATEPSVRLGVVPELRDGKEVLVFELDPELDPSLFAVPDA